MNSCTRARGAGEMIAQAEACDAALKPALYGDMEQSSTAADLDVESDAR